MKWKSMLQIQIACVYWVVVCVWGRLMLMATISHELGPWAGNVWILILDLASDNTSSIFSDFFLYLCNF